MEQEIINELMTLTVSQLFTINRASHCKFFKLSSQLNESKNDIPIGRESTSNLLGPFSSQCPPDQQPSITEWVNQEGRQFLEDAIIRLKIDTKRFLYMEQEISRLPLEDLNKVKKNVKNELKRYDISFNQKFYRAPSKTEKEPLRPLYMYYKKLKQHIERKMKSLQNNNGQQKGNSVDKNSRAYSLSSQVSSYSKGSSVQSLSNSREGSLTQNNSTHHSTNSQNLVKREEDILGWQPQHQMGNHPQKKLNQPQSQSLGQIQLQPRAQTAKVGERKNSTGSVGSQSTQSILSNQPYNVALEKEGSQGRLLGVRGSVELKSINSVGGLTKTDGQNQQSISGNGFTWTSSSKHQASKSNTNSASHSQNMKNEVGNIRKSAQASTMASLLEGNFNQPQNKGFQNNIGSRQNGNHNRKKNEDILMNEFAKENINQYESGMDHGAQQQVANGKSRQQQEIKEKISSFKKERQQLRVKLDEYQQDFQKLHNRKIKFRNDIKPVADDFKRYKDLKEEIQQLESLLGK